jgi:hypothetical protein
MPDVSAAQKRRKKLERVVEFEGYPNLEELLRDASVDSACPGICTTFNTTARFHRFEGTDLLIDARCSRSNSSD